MPKLITRRSVLAGAAAAGVLGPTIIRPDSVFAAAMEIQMLNKHPDNPRQRMVFLPLVTSVEAGTEIKFVASDKGHNSQTIDGMIPDGGPEWDGKLNEEVTVKLERPGVYGYKCQPHMALGMVGLIIVKGDGMTDNVEAAKAVKHRGRAKKVFDEIWAQVEAENLLA